ncbi:MAG: 4Fe-4S binding protein [Spirochaetales bacterium]|nr:4Fe-4S binding protein [Spirochaetales bacterium]
MIHLTIQGINVEVDAGATVLDAAKKAGVKIPTLCYHSDLKPFGSCGLCICKQEGSNKIIRACATPAAEGMKIITHDPELFEVRKSIIQLILSTHPSSCLMCVRNNKCELQNLAIEYGVREQPFTIRMDVQPKDTSTGAIILDPSKCVKCGRCVQVCQDLQGVFALEFIGRGDHTYIKPAAGLKLADSPCIKCGQCATHCPVGAIYELDESKKLIDAIYNPEKVVAVQMAPSVRVAIGEEFGLAPGVITTGKLYTALRRIGVDYVFDTNFGADLTIMEEGYELIHRVTKGGVLPQITSCCPGWIDYVRKYYPDLIENLSSAKSPMMMQGAMTKTYWAQKQGVDAAKVYSVAIMPCTAKKTEINRDDSMKSSGYDDVDLVLTTRELARLFHLAGVDFNNLPETEVDSPIGEYTGAGTIFGATGGVMEAALRTAYFAISGEELANPEIELVRGTDFVKRGSVDVKGTEVRVAVVHGMANAKELLEEIREAKANGTRAPYEFIEVMACKGGCIAGGGQPLGTDDEVRAQRTAGLYTDDEKSVKRCSHQNPSIITSYKEFLGEPLSEKAHHLLHTSYTPVPVYKN